MYDGIKILDLLIAVTRLLTHKNLAFGVLVDPQTGAVLNPIQKATDRELTFTVVPTKADRNKYRVELAGSLHRYGRGGLHNADDFTAANLRAVVESLVRTYGINAEQSKLNSVEFGVNLQLPFPVVNLLRSLICYRGVPFTLHNDNGFDYYQAKLQQYVVKVYDKGTQYGLPGHVLRFEIKVLRMHYLHRQSIPINTLSDLLNPTHYPALGRLLVEAFQAILFDELLVSKTDVPNEYRELLIEGRHPRYWQRPEPGRPDYEQRRKRLQRDETRFRNLLAEHRPGGDWQRETAALLLTKWDELTGKNGDQSAKESEPVCPQLTKRKQRETVFDELPICPKLTGVIKGAKTGHLSQINTKDVGTIWDNEEGVIEPVSLNPETPIYCEVTVREQAVNGTKTQQKFHPRPRPTATDLRTNPELLAIVEQGRKQYAKGSKESREERAAHLLRNDESNPRHNSRNSLKRAINKIHHHPVLFDVSSTLRLNSEQRGRLNHSDLSGTQND